jgi:hypothetical protein
MILNMKFNILFFFLFLKVYSQNKYTVASVSDKFYFEVYGKKQQYETDSRFYIENCKIRIYNKISKKLIQEVISDQFLFFIDKRSIQIKKGKLYEGNPILIYDFNFDGIDDLAISNFTNFYGGSNYDFYFYNKKSKTFIKDKQLSEICTEGQGLFRINKLKKRIRTEGRSAMSIYIWSVYEYIPQKKKFELKREVVSEYDEVPDLVKQESRPVDRYTDTKYQGKKIINKKKWVNYHDDKRYEKIRDNYCKNIW